MSEGLVSCNAELGRAVLGGMQPPLDWDLEPGYIRYKPPWVRQLSAGSRIPSSSWLRALARATRA